MDSAIAIRNIRKTYKEKIALDNLSLDIKKGKVVGILGPNGSGKSTLLKIMAGIIKADKGDILVFGNKPSAKTRAQIGFLPDGPYLYETMKIKDIIDIYDSFYKGFDKDLMDRYLDYVYLDRDSKISGLSKGDNNKLGLCLNLARKADIYIFDEPLAGVDPTSHGKLINVLIDMIDGERTFILSTHEIENFEHLFDDVVFLNDGKIDIVTSAQDLRDEYTMDIKNYYDYKYVG